MAKLKKNTIDWLFNLPNACKAITSLGARNLTTIDAVYITSDKQEHVKQYSKMVQHESDEADEKAIKFMTDITIEQKKIDERYLYFRFKRWN